ncbi:uroporphyrinogen-III synthase [Microvirga sp. 2TAF3]|uniref:uroporphyrinogen-III synthase n=1 Tax=Microvirga sp. 2TAF3 TaxID=3233014 RepID=UPI003F985779
MRILVTRSQDDAERTAGRLADLGHEAILAPVTRIVSTDDPKPVGSWDALIVTSIHAGPALAVLRDKHYPVFAVGERTAGAVREAGFTSIAVAEGDAKSLSALIRGRLEPGRSLLHVTARHHKDEPAASLRAAGFRVEQWEAYEAEAVENLSLAAVEALRTGRIDAALHYSRRSTELFIRLTEEAGLTSILRTVLHLCLSDDVAAPFEALGIPTLAASRPDEDALLALLATLP